MLSTSAHMARLQDKLKNIKEALHYTDVALAHDDYTKPFHFKNENEATPSEFEEELTRIIIDELNNRKLGFDPDLVVQHIESETLDQFNDIVKKHLKGKGIVPT